MKAKFREGDEVVLKTGRTVMKVKEVIDENWVLCTWVETNGRKKEDKFKTSTLELWDTYVHSPKTSSVGG